MASPCSQYHIEEAEAAAEEEEEEEEEKATQHDMASPRPEDHIHQEEEEEEEKGEEPAAAAEEEDVEEGDGEEPVALEEEEEEEEEPEEEDEETDEEESLEEGSEDELSRYLQESLSLASTRHHAFWETQPVQQYTDNGMQLEEGPIAAPQNASDLRQEPYRLPKDYEWCTCDIRIQETLDEIYGLLRDNYVEDDESMFRFDYSRELLRWALMPPGYIPSWHVGVRVQASQKLVAFISGVPARICVHGLSLTMAEINFLCIHKKLRAKRLAPVLIREITRRVHLENVWQAVYTAGVVLPTPLTTCQYWHRSLNPKKLIEVGFSILSSRMTMSRTIKRYRLPRKPCTPGFRAMSRHDVQAVHHLLRKHLAPYIVAPDFSEEDVQHWLVPVKDVMNSYVVEDPASHEITDFCSFYTLPSSILGNQNYDVLKAAYSFYNVATNTPLAQLMSDVLIVAKREGHDVFNALDIMGNQSFLKELKFGPGDGYLHYYFYNYRLGGPMVPSDLGLVLL